jgi:hypothetical protein
MLSLDNRGSNSGGYSNPRSSSLKAEGMTTVPGNKWSPKQAIKWIPGHKTVKNNANH